MNSSHSIRSAYRQRGDALLSILALLAVLCLIGLLSRWKPAQNLVSNNYADFNAVTPGWSEKQTEVFLGQPKHEYEVASVPQNWKVRAF
ncbi:MAG TPA: hypothetical protein VGH19_15960 [Verrucomicrobiae bacterium]